MQDNIMESVHGETEKQRNDRRIRRVLIVFGVMVLVAAAAITASLIWRDPTHMHNPNESASQVITIAVTLVMGALIIFIWGMKLTPLLSYRKYLREIHSGLSRDVEGVVTQLDTQTTFRDGLSFYGMIVNVGDLKNPEDERLLYWDAQLGTPPVAEGDKVCVHAHGNDIISYAKR